MSDKRRNHEAGVALVLAILALMLLTFLGLTLAATTSTELQIAANYRWSQQAFYNAEAGLEIGKRLLETADWSVILPTLRPLATGWPGNTSPSDPAGTAANRNYDNWKCDKWGFGAGYGRVLEVDGIRYADVSDVAGHNLNGSFTLWVRRPVKGDEAGLLHDEQDNDGIIIVSEGVAPYQGGALATLVAQQNRAVRTMEIRLSREGMTCGTRAGQVGGGPEGSGFGGCVPIDPSSLQRALGLADTPTQDLAVR